jgi:hypothetical protein
MRHDHKMIKKFTPQLTRAALALIVAIVGALTLQPTTANAFSFKPTASEWAMWPEHCRARYASLQVGKHLPFVAAYPPAMISAWRSRLGEKTFTHLHHYCASLAYMQRASSAQSNQERNHLLKSAEGECRYTLSRIPPTSPVYREVAGHMQMVQALRGAAR